MECIFCKIINNEINSYTVYEDEYTKVFLDINPDENGHLLIIPKKHIKNISDIDLDTFNHIIKVTKKMNILLKEKLNIDGLTLIQNNGISQDVKHFHLHLKPAYKEKQTALKVQEVYAKLK